MALAILKLDGAGEGVELRTTDTRICRTIWRLMSTEVTPEEMGLLADPLPASEATY